MAKVVLDVKTSDLKTVMTILKNLKPGLIQKIDTSGTTAAKPVSSSLGNNQSNSKYSNSAYKQRLQQKVEEDEFLSQSSPSKYLSKDAYKQRLNK